MIGAKLDFLVPELSVKDIILAISLQRKNHLRASLLIAQNKKEHCQVVPSVGYVGVYRKQLGLQHTKKVMEKKD